MLVAVLWHCTWGKGQEGAMALAQLSAGFQSLPLLPTIKLGLSGADSWMGGLVHALGPYGSLQGTLLFSWEVVLLPPQLPWVFSIRGLRLYIPVLEPWVEWSALLPRCSSQFIYTRLWGLRVCQPPPCGVRQLQPGLPPSIICHLSGSASCRLAASPLRPGCLSPPLLPVWMNFSSLSPWCWTPYSLFFCQFLLFFVFKLLLSFFWLWEEAQCVYLHLHLGQKLPNL